MHTTNQHTLQHQNTIFTDDGQWSDGTDLSLHISQFVVSKRFKSLCINQNRRKVFDVMLMMMIHKIKINGAVFEHKRRVVTADTRLQLTVGIDKEVSV